MDDKEYHIGCGPVDGGVDVWDWNDETHPDGRPKYLAHINNQREITYFEDNLPQEVIGEIQAIVESDWKELFAIEMAGFDYNPPPLPSNFLNNEPQGHLYLEQVAKWIENKTGMPQQIIHTSDDIRYVNYDSPDNAMHMTIIADANIKVNSISWSAEHGIGLNAEEANNANSEKVHVMLWSDTEVSKDERGYYMDAEGAQNGVLVIKNSDIKVTGDIVQEMLNMGEPQNLHHDRNAENHSTPIYPINICIQNAHDTNVDSFTISLPATREEWQPFFETADISEWRDLAITEVTSDISGLGEKLYRIICADGIMPDTLDELNYLAARIKTIAERGEYGGIEIFSANIEVGRNCSSIAEMVNLTYDESLNQFDVHPVYDAKDYGDILVNQFMPDEHAIVFNNLKDSDDSDDRAFAAYVEKLEQNIDKETFGRATAKEENGVFTEQGYLSGVSGGLPQHYRGVQDIPAENCLLSASERNVARFIKIDDVNIAEAIVKLHAVGCKSMERAAHNVTKFCVEHRQITENMGGNHFPNHYLVLQNRSDICIVPVMDIYRRGSEMNKFALSMTESAGTDDMQSDIKVFALRVNNSRSEEAGNGLRGDMIEFSPKAFHANITRYAATPDRVNVLRDNGEKKSYDLFEWGQMLQKDGNSSGLVAFRYPEGGLDKACNNFCRIMGSHERMSHAESFEFHLPRINAPNTGMDNPHLGMIHIAGEAAKEILACGDADVYQVAEDSVVKLNVIEALRPMCFAEYKDLAIKHEDAVGLGKWAERKVDKIIRQAARDERSRQKNRGEEL